MKICMVVYDMQPGGGLEEYLATLAVGLMREHHQVSVLSTAWVPSDNQYLQRLRAANVPFLQLPRWLSLPGSDWNTKEKTLATIIQLLTPLVYVLAAARSLVKQSSWRQSLESTRGWLRRQIGQRFIGRDWRKPFARLLLRWWQFYWRPDIHHLQGYTSNLLFVIDWLHSQQLPMVYEEHQTPDPQFSWWNDFGRSINKATTVVAVSEKSAQALRTVCGVTQPILVRSPLLPDPLTEGWSREAHRERSPTALQLTTVARLYVTKGLEYLLEAVAQVNKIYPNVQLRVYGDGPLREALCQRAAELALDGDAIFVGAFTDRAELARVMAQTDIFVMASVLEGQPLSLVEAMAYGCPIVSTNVGGIPELIQDGVNGLLCAPRDFMCLAQKIQQLIENPDLRMRLGQAARKTYLDGPFQPTSVCTHLISIYENTLRARALQQPSGSSFLHHAQS